MNDRLGELIGSLLAGPFVALADWFTFIKQQPPGLQELTKACHGVGMLALLAYGFELFGGFGNFLQGLLLRPSAPLQWIPVGMAIWGLAWVLLNARFAAQAVFRPQRGTMIGRALVKIAVAYGALTCANATDGWIRLLLCLFAVWCGSTGGTKLLLMVWGGRSDAQRRVVDHIRQRTGEMNPARRRSF